jgi:hypothetical protein
MALIKDKQFQEKLDFIGKVYEQSKRNLIGCKVTKNFGFHGESFMDYRNDFSAKMYNARSNGFRYILMGYMIDNGLTFQENLPRIRIRATLNSTPRS